MPPAGARQVHSTAYNLEDQQRMAQAKNYFAWQSRLVEREIGQRALEVGCGIGNLTGMLLDRELVVAVDAEAECVERVNLRYPSQPNLHTFVCDALSADFLALRRFRLDSCVCVNVLEHVEDDSNALRAMGSVLPRGGVLVLLIPAFQSLYGPIDRNLGHYRRYSRASVAKLAASCSLRIRKLHYLNLPGFFGWWLNARVFKREAQSERQVEIFDRYVVPLLSHIEALVRPPFGQSLFTVLEKP